MTDSLVKYVIALEERYIPYNAKQYRLRCNGHIINLTAQAFLFLTKDEALLEKNNLSSLYIPTQLEMETWLERPLLESYIIL